MTKSIDEIKRDILVKEINIFYTKMIFEYGLPRDRDILDNVAVNILHKALTLLCTPPRNLIRDKELLKRDIWESKDQFMFLTTEAQLNIIKKLEDLGLREKKGE